MIPAGIEAIESCLRLKNRIRGVGRHPDPLRHFGPGGVEQAEASCARANRDLLAFLRPSRDTAVRNLTHAETRGLGGPIRETLRFDSPRPSGNPRNDRVQARLVRSARTPDLDRVAIFHHALYQRRWRVWEWFLADVIDRIPVVMMAGPYHFDRVPEGEYAGESVCNPNPWKLFLALRQWCADEHALRLALTNELGLRPVAVLGFSFGAFQSLLIASAGWLDLPVVSMASTNRYAYGVFHGAIGRGIREGMLRVGIDEARLARMTESLRLERWVRGLAGRPVLYVDGAHDRVDPPPSLDRLRRALDPPRAIRLPAGHATLLMHRGRIVEETVRFLEEQAVL